MDLTAYDGTRYVVADDWDSDGDLKMMDDYFRRDTVRALRDHLTALLGTDPATAATAARETASRLRCAGLPVQDGIADAFETFAHLLDKETP
ncbi:hypothetical protein DER29_0460 [Micromonospora sp. M71_S20]|uniref:hypothetical protein n=1 Tax=Micromonospora sp. M71_S20 TaxID=592872 RepID=UPI000EB124AC|nr:hypothetical protein [Micromonospora sp. M71_S20]RLK22623.1 hypothetical protein DER29_0460 [Micromonospora sp. M71_S20]